MKITAKNERLEEFLKTKKKILTSAWIDLWEDVRLLDEIVNKMKIATENITASTINGKRRPFRNGNGFLPRFRALLR